MFIDDFSGSWSSATKAGQRLKQVRTMGRTGFKITGLRDYEGLGKLKMPKAIKKITKPLGKIAAAQVGLMTLGLVKPKVFHIYSKSGQHFYRAAGNIGKVAAVAAAVYLSAGTLGPAAGTVGSKLKGFFTGSGLSKSATEIATNAVLEGREPVPPGALDSVDSTLSTQASMFGGASGFLMPIIVISGAVALFMIGGKKHGKR